MSHCAAHSSTLAAPVHVPMSQLMSVAVGGMTTPPLKVLQYHERPYMLPLNSSSDGQGSVGSGAGSGLVLSRAAPPTRAWVASILMIQPSAGDCDGPCKMVSVTMGSEAAHDSVTRSPMAATAQEPTLQVWRPVQAGLPLIVVGSMLHSII